MRKLFGMHVSVYAIITTKDTQVTGVDINAIMD